VKVADRRRGALALATIVGLAGLSVLLGTAGGGGDGSPRSSFSLGAARGFSDFPVYYAGDAVQGVPLVAVLRREDAANYVSFVYGQCDAQDEVGCAPPGEVQVWPACVRNPSVYARNRSPVAPRPVPSSVRGVPAAAFEEGHRLEIQTGKSTVVVFGHTPQFVRALAAELRGVNLAVERGAPLPAPAQGVLDGSLSCTG
jgi:hypothetical protein